MNDEAQELWKKLGKPEAVRATPEQLLAFMRECSDEVGHEIARRMLESSDQAAACFEMGHDTMADELLWLRVKLADEVNRKMAAS